jgi:threonine/homoserine/homoserine lactone efflux protein
MLRKIMITVMALVMLSLLASLLVEVVAERYLNAIALFGVASVLMWFALQMLQRRTLDDEEEPEKPED